MPLTSPLLLRWCGISATVWTRSGVLALSGLLCSTAGAGTDADPYAAPEGALFRVDLPHYPGALAASDWGSVLLSPPPAGIPYRNEAIPVPDSETLSDGVGDFVAWEAMEAMGVGPWHEAGFRGQGVSIAVFDLEWAGISNRWEEIAPVVSTHDCWAHPQCTAPIDDLNPRFAYEDGVHGIACAEIVRDLAPEAALYLVRVNGQTSYENAVSWAIREGIDVITMSLSFFNESFYDGTGPISERVADLSEAGVLMATSAGNYADQHWTEAFDDPDGDGHHAFPWGQGFPIWVPAGSNLRVSMNWDNYTRCGDTDLDLRLTDAEGDLIASSEEDQSPDAERCFPLERLSAFREEAGWTTLHIIRAGGDPSVMFDLIVRGGDMYDTMPERSLMDPGTHPLAWTIAAVRSAGYLNNGPELFSSQGPTQGDLDKPDIAAPNGLTTAAYGPTGFYGTSASSPAAAAALALVMSRDPDLTSREAADYLVDQARGASNAWSDYNYGLGAGHLILPDPTRTLCGGQAQAWLMPLLLVSALRRRALPLAFASASAGSSVMTSAKSPGMR